MANSYHHASDDAIAGAFAGFITRMMTAPFDVMKIRYQILRSESLSRSNILEVTRSIVRNEGIFALWKGNIPAICLWISYSYVQFGLYGSLRNIHQPTSTGESLRMVIPPIISRSFSHFLHGSIAGTVATLLTYPFDLMRTQFAVQSQQSVHKSMISYCIRTYKLHGITGKFSFLIY